MIDRKVVCLWCDTSHRILTSPGRWKTCKQIKKCCQCHLHDFFQNYCNAFCNNEPKSVLPVCWVADSAFWSDSTIGICLADWSFSWWVLSMELSVVFERTSIFGEGFSVFSLTKLLSQIPLCVCCLFICVRVAENPSGFLSYFCAAFPASGAWDFFCCTAPENTSDLATLEDDVVSLWWGDLQSTFLDSLMLLKASGNSKYELLGARFCRRFFLNVKIVPSLSMLRCLSLTDIESDLEHPASELSWWIPEPFPVSFFFSQLGRRDTAHSLSKLSSECSFKKGVCFWLVWCSAAILRNEVAGATLCPACLLNGLGHRCQPICRFFDTCTWWYNIYTRAAVVSCPRPHIPIICIYIVILTFMAT